MSWVYALAVSVRQRRMAKFCNGLLSSYLDINATLKFTPINGLSHVYPCGLNIE